MPPALAAVWPLTARGNLFVADGASGVIYKFTPSGMRSTFASGLASVGSLTVDRAGNLFVADGISGILKFTPNGVRTTIASRVGGPMAVDGAGNLFVATQGLPDGRSVANTYTIYKFNSDGVRSTFASGYLSKTIGFFVSLGVDSSGNLCLVDAGDIYDGGGSAIYKFTRGGNRSTFFGPTPLWTGSSCNFGDLAIDSMGNVFVTDSCTGIDKITQDGNRTVFASGIEGSLAFQPPQGPSPTLLNISARRSVGGGENPLIAGFILAGSDPEQVITRGLGPTLNSFRVSALQDPVLALHPTYRQLHRDSGG